MLLPTNPWRHRTGHYQCSRQDILRRTFFSSGKFTHAEKKWAKYVNQTHTRVCNYRLELVKGVYSRSPVWKALSLKTHSVVGQCGWPNVRTFSERSGLKDESTNHLKCMSQSWFNTAYSQSDSVSLCQRNSGLIQETPLPDTVQHKCRFLGHRTSH